MVGWCKVATAAKYLEVSERTLRKLIARREIPFARMPSGTIRLQYDAMDQYMKDLQQPVSVRSRDAKKIVDEVCKGLI